MLSESVLLYSAVPDTAEPGRSDRHESGPDPAVHWHVACCTGGRNDCSSARRRHGLPGSPPWHRASQVQSESKLPIAKMLPGGGEARGVGGDKWTLGPGLADLRPQRKSKSVLPSRHSPCRAAGVAAAAASL